jgi:hypothetical protein
MDHTKLGPSWFYSKKSVFLYLILQLLGLKTPNWKKYLLFIILKLSPQGTNFELKGPKLEIV